MPFAGYDDFADCVSKNQDKNDPEAYCASIHEKATGKWPSEKEKMNAELKMLGEQIAKKDNPIQANPANPNNLKQHPEEKNIPEDNEPKKKMMQDIKELEEKVKEQNKPEESKPEDIEECAAKKKKYGESAVKDYLSKNKTFQHSIKSKEARKYIKSPSEAPAGANVQQGARGGYFYDTEPISAGEGRPDQPSPDEQGEWNEIVNIVNDDVAMDSVFATLKDIGYMDDNDIAMVKSDPDGDVYASLVQTAMENGWEKPAGEPEENSTKQDTDAKINQLIKDGELEIVEDGFGNFEGFMDEGGHLYKSQQDVVDAWGLDEDPEESAEKPKKLYNQNNNPDGYTPSDEDAEYEAQHKYGMSWNELGSDEQDGIMDDLISDWYSGEGNAYPKGFEPETIEKNYGEDVRSMYEDNLKQGLKHTKAFAKAVSDAKASMRQGEPAPDPEKKPYFDDASKDYYIKNYGAIPDFDWTNNNKNKVNQVIDAASSSGEDIETWIDSNYSNYDLSDSEWEEVEFELSSENEDEVSMAQDIINNMDNQERKRFYDLQDAYPTMSDEEILEEMGY